MRSRIHFLFLLSPFLLLLLSCGPGNSQEPTTEAPSSSATDVDCMSRPDYICEQGLGLAPLGTMVAIAAVEGVEPQDSIIAQEGYVWLTRTLPFTDGSVVIEGQFIDERSYSDTLVSESTINRIRISSPSFQTREEIRVGSTVLALQEQFPDSTFLVDAVPGFPVLQLRLSSSHIIYLIPDQAYTPSPEQDYPSFDRLDPYAKIESIVVM